MSSGLFQLDYGINDETMWDGWTFRNFYTKGKICCFT